MAGRRSSINSIGEQFDRLFVLDIYKINGASKAYCICNCGNTKVTLVSSLRRGCTRSCGCLNAENTQLKGLNNRRHGHSRRLDGGRSKSYKLWSSMIRRCHTPSSSGFHKYGAKGVIVCKEWRESFETFLKDMGEPPKGLSIDRIDNSKGYSKDNCRWATAKQQARNKTTTFKITIDGETKSLIDWVERYKMVEYATVNCRLKRGWDPLQALTAAPGSVPRKRRSVKISK